MKRRILTVLSVGVIVVGMAVVASAQGRGNRNGQDDNKQKDNKQNGNGSVVPEINPSSAVQAVALLTGGLLVLRGCRRRP